MAPTIDIIRHAQASHNIHGSHVRDAKLTEVGLRECIILRGIYPFGSKVTNVVSSPLRRAIETAIIGVLPMVDDDIKIKLLPGLQEISPSPSSTGIPKTALYWQYDGENLIDMDDLDQDWYQKDSNSPYAPAVRKVEARAQSVRKYLRMLAIAAIEAGKDDAHIMVVTHGEFAHWLTGDFRGVSETCNSGWHNTEYRSYQIENIFAPDDIDPILVETTESIMGRNGPPFGQPRNSVAMIAFRQIAARRVEEYSEILEYQDVPPYETTDESDETDDEYDRLDISGESEGWVDVDDEF